MTASAVRQSSEPTSDAPERHRWTVADYYRLAETGVFNEDSRIELINGEVMDMAPIGSSHSYALNTLTRSLYQSLPNRVLIRVQDPVHLDHHNEPQPDLVVALDRDYSAQHPMAGDILLVIEVADTSVAYDRDVKIPLYGRHGIPMAGLLDVANKTLTLYQDPFEAGYRQAKILQAGDHIVIGDLRLPADDLLPR